MVDSTVVEQVRERVLQLSREIEELSKSNAPPQTFFPEFLRMLVSALGASAGAVWLLENGNQFHLGCDVGFAKTRIAESPESSRRNHKLLADVIATGQAFCCSPDDNSAQPPSEHVIVLAALQTDNECVGVVEIFQRADSPAEARSGYLQYVEQMCGYASRYLDRQKNEESGETLAEFWQGFEQFVLNLQRTLNVAEVSATAVNDGRWLLGCDRVSLARKRGKKTVILAISGQDAVNQRANLVRSMRGLVSKVIASGEPVSSAEGIEDLPRQIEEPLGDFIQQSGSRLVMAVPLFENEPLIDPNQDSQEHSKTKRRRQPIGCLVIEQVAQSRPAPKLLDRVELLSDHVSSALSNARAHERIFLLPLWRFLGRCLEWFYGRKLVKTAVALAVVAGIGLGMAYVPMDYRVEGEGRLMPVVQREVFAPWEGEVVKVYVEGGQRVEKNQPLLQLHNDDLQAQLLKSRNELLQKREQVVALQAQIDDATSQADQDAETRLLGELATTRIEIEGLIEQVKIFEQREASLTVRTPIAGVVATFQVEQILIRRPVRRGEILVEVMDDTGRWHLELEVEEHRMGHILRAQEKLDTKDLAIEFILATSAESTFSGTLEKIATRPATSPEQGSVVQIYASIDAQELTDRRIGAEVRAKINCGQRSLGYVLFGDVVEFVHKYFWL